MALPERTQQVIQTYAQFIHAIATACFKPELMVQTQQMLTQAEQQGWVAMVMAVRQVLAGKRDSSVYTGLDDDDRIIIEAILRGIQDPTTLPDPNQQPDPSAAAPGLGGMIHAAATGDVPALSALADMAEQMVKVAGDMGRLGGSLRRLVNGERDVDLLTRGMSASGRDLVTKLVDELARYNVH
jgi:hypothetical protein